MRIICKDINATPEIFNELHGKGLFLGGSEIATAAGLNKFQTPIDLFMRKSGRNLEIVDNKFTRRGNFLERAVADMFLDEHKQYSSAEKITSTFQHDSIDWAICTPDFCLKEDPDCKLWEPGANTLLEVKTHGYWAKKEYAQDGIPDAIRVQLIWQMGIMGIETGFVGALIAGEPWFSEPIKFNKDVFDQLVELGGKFLDLVRADTIPDSRWDDNLNFIKPTESEIELTDCKDLIEQYLLLKKEISESESLIKLKDKAISEVKNKLITRMQSAGKARCSGYVISRKIIQIKGSVRAASEQVRFSIKKENQDDEA